MNTLYTAPGKSLLLALLLLALPSLSYAQFVDNKGTDFYTSFQPNLINPFGIELHLTADVATNVTVHYPVNSPTFDMTVAVVPGDITIVTLPNTASQGWTFGTVQNNAVRAFSTNEFVAYTVNRASASSDAALALPVDALNTDYLVQTYTPQFFGAQFIVVAAFDDTEVTITPSATLRSGQPAGTPFTVTLDRGEGFYGLSQGTSGTTNDLSGTLIQATKPVAMTNGNGCTQVPIGTTACDHIYEVAQPLASWGNEAFVAPLPLRIFGSRYRVIAAEDNTTVELDGAVVATLDRGEFHETGTITGPHVFNADKPIFVTQYMTGVTGSGSSVGDPAMGNMVPSEQYLSAYTFSTVGGNQFVQNFLSIIAENDDVANGTILLDGVAIPAASFTAIAGTGFSFATIELSDGTHTTQSAGLHGITVEGYNSADSYIYPGGARFEFINPGMDTTPPVCAGTLNGTTFSGSATDLLSDDPENRGIFFVALGAGSTNLNLAVDPFTPGDEVVTYTVTLVDPTTDGTGSVVATDGAGNTCSTPISILVDGEVDTTPPVCGPITFDLSQAGKGIYEVVSSASDPESGIASVTFTRLSNMQGYVDGNGPFDMGGTYTTPDPNPTSVELRGRLVNTASGRFTIVARVTNEAGLSSNCDPVVTDLDGALPEQTALLQAYPNPLRVGSGAGMSVPFSLAEASHVRVVVYDVLGRAVAVLAEDDFGAGRYEVSWPEASALPAGTYLVRMEAGTYHETRRITLVR